MTFEFTVNFLLLINLLSKYLLRNSLVHLEAPAYHSSLIILPVVSNTIEINGIKLQAEVGEV